MLNVSNNSQLNENGLKILFEHPTLTQLVNAHAKMTH